MSTPAKKRKPLEGLKVLEMGQMLAGPFASALLAWFGADVIKIEPPVGGDPIRSWRLLYKGTSLWWYVLGRNKKCITIDLRKPNGQDLVRKLVPKVDIIVENFTPGTMEKWNLGYETLRSINPRLIMARISGWGQTGPYSKKPGFASVAEAIGGFRYVNGFPDQPPVRPNLSLGDSLAGLHAAFGILAAIYHRDSGGQGKGQVVDVAIYESVFNMLESIVPEYDKLGITRERAGSTLTGIVPTGTYPSKDHKFVVIGGNGDAIFRRLCGAMARGDMADDSRFTNNAARVTHQQEIEKVITDWSSQRTASDIVTILEQADVPVGLIYSAGDMLQDPHFIARGLFESVTLPDGTGLKIPAITPQLMDTPGGTEWIGSRLGEHNRQVLGGLLGLSDQDMQNLAADGTIAPLADPVSAAIE